MATTTQIDCEMKGVQTMSPKVNISQDRSFELKTLVRIMFICSLNISVGCVFAYTSPALPSIIGKKEGSIRSFDLSLEQQSLISSIPNMGGFFGSLFCGFLADRYGRKLCIIAQVVPFVVGWLLIATATNFTMLLVGRFITGVCSSFTFILLPGYLAETSTPKMRENVGAFLSTSSGIGMLLMNVSGVFLSWRYLALGCEALLAMTMLTLPLMRESPRWLLSKGQVETADENLRWLRATDDVHDELETIREHLMKFGDVFSSSGGIWRWAEKLMEMTDSKKH